MERPQNPASNNHYSIETYNNMLEDIFVLMRKLAKYKGGEYAGDVDRLANFRRNAEAMGMDMVQIWAVYYAKHHDSIMQYVKDVGQGMNRVRLENLEERALDMMVYLSLFISIIDEAQGGGVSEKLRTEARLFKMTQQT